VGRDRERVDVEGARVHGDLPRRLHRIAMDEGASLPRDAHEVLHGLHDSGLVVGEHQRHDRRAVVHLAAQVIEVQAAVHADARRLDGHALLGERLGGVHHRVVLDRRIDHLAPGLAGRRGRSPQRHVVGLGAAAGEDDLAGGPADEARHLLAGGVHRGARLLPEPVQARRVAEALPQDRQHGIENAGIERGRRVVIEVDAAHLRIVTLRAGPAQNIVLR